jgi:hypothetical protein
MQATVPSVRQGDAEAQQELPRQFPELQSLFSVQ